MRDNIGAANWEIVSVQFAIKMYVAPENRKNTNTLYFGFSGSFKVMMLVPPDSSSAALVTISRQVCAYLQQFSR